jgi:hypothetical protein
MKSLADTLPSEIARQIHPDWRKNEAAYWAVRDQLLGQYQGKWIAFADGAVIAASKTSLDVYHAPGVLERHPFVICVGREDEPYRIRRAAFAFDSTYAGQALPVQTASSSCFLISFACSPARLQLSTISPVRAPKALSNQISSRLLTGATMNNA